MANEPDKGEVAAVILTYGVVDKDGDLHLPGAIAHGSPVFISDYAHGAVFRGSLPVGAGRIFNEGDEAIFRGKYFIELPHGAAAFGTVRGLLAKGVAIEWSWVFDKRVETAELTPAWRARGAKQVVRRAVAVEVSPVTRGAGVRTRTIEAKAAARIALEDDADVQAELARFRAITSRITPRRRFDMRQYWRLTDDEFVEAYDRWLQET